MNVATSIQIPTAVKRIVYQKTGTHLHDQLKGEVRPWGGFVLLSIEKFMDEKIIWLRPCLSESFIALSLQMHGIGSSEGHDEYWKALSNISLLYSSTKIKINGKEDRFAFLKDLESDLAIMHLSAGQEVKIESGEVHALMNLASDYLVVQETRISRQRSRFIDDSYRERDIFRIMDQFGRDNAIAYNDSRLGNFRDQIVSSYKEFRHTKRTFVRQSLSLEQ